VKAWSQNNGSVSGEGAELPIDIRVVVVVVAVVVVVVVVEVVAEVVAVWLMTSTE